MAFILQDFFSFAPSASREGSPSVDPEIREQAKNGKGLKVTFIASHAGMVNKNYVMYSPQGMKNSAYTWHWPQRRPIQVHHDDHADPIGRIISARYQAYSDYEVKDSHRDALHAFQDAKKLDGTVAAARALEKAGVLNQHDWKGVGELVLEGIITDSAAIEKILDGRYLGISITQSPESALCSICGKDWVQDYCEHDRGEKDEESGSIMYLIVGDTDYAEASYVNRPADKHAMNTEAQLLNSFSDNFETQSCMTDSFGILDRSSEIAVSFQLVDSVSEEKNMDPKSKSTKVKTEEQDSGVDESTIQDRDNSDETQDESKTEDLSIDKTSTEDSNLTQDTETSESSKITIEEALRCLFEDRDNITGFMCDVLFEAGETFVDKEDARLSVVKRKSLPSSIFCGPNRSFPVNDSDHYIAAKSLLDKYQGEGNKTAICNCIEEKGKALGCTTSQDEKTRDEIAQDSFDIKSLSDDDLLKTVLDVEKALVSRGLKAERKCNDCEDKDATISDLEIEVPALRDTVTVLRSEYRTVVSEHSSSEESHMKTLEALQSVLIDTVTSKLLLTDNVLSEEDITAKVTAMTLEDLKKNAKEINLSEVISFVRSGLSAKPNEKVESSDAEAEEEIGLDIPVKLSESLIKLEKKYGRQYAAGVLNDWCRAGKLPAGFTLDKASKLVAK